MNPPPAPSIHSAVARVFIIAYQEDVSALQAELERTIPEVRVLRQKPSEETRTFSPNLRCLLNHASGWEIAATTQGLSLFVEADFVPCRNFGSLPLPFDPAHHGTTAWGYIYAGGSRIYERLPSGHLLAHACSTVAYVMPAEVVRLGLKYVTELRKRHKDWSIYHPFDTELQWHLMGMGARAFVPWRQLGEHGGKANPEHVKTGMGSSLFRRLLARFGIGLNHYADALHGPLAFLPLYAEGSRWRLAHFRLEGIAFGWLRLLSGKTISPLVPLSLNRRLALYWHGAIRLFP